MQSVIERLKTDAEEVKQMLTDMITNHSSIRRWRNPNDDFFIVGRGDYAWNDLPVTGKQLQGRILKKYNRFVAMINMLIYGLPSQDIKTVEEAEQNVIEVIEQTNSLFDGAKDKVIRDTMEEIDKQLAVLESLYDPTPDENIYVPDTNALLTNPNLEVWSFAGVDKFTLVLTPTVLSELDKLKVDGRREELRDKAKMLVRKIKEYIRRGDIFEGVKLSGKNSIRSIAVEPDFDKALPSLNSDNNDDRLIAGYYEVVREHTSSHVILVTADVNMQNKAAFYGVIFEEPPEIVQ